MLELNQCYNMDCMEGMEQFPEGFFDLAVVDPPYFSGPERRGYYGSKVSKIGVYRDYPVSPAWEIPGRAYFDELRRVFNAWLEKHGLPTITPTFYTDKDGNRLTLEAECLRLHALPSIAYGFKKCSIKHKIGTQEKFCNHYPPCVEVWKSGGRVNKYIGYDAGETRRVQHAALEDEANKKIRKTLPALRMGLG